jgi:putative hydrolases of HD superfamily
VEAAEERIRRLLTAASVLKRLPRTGWLVAGVAQVESVAEHSFVTAILALSLGEAINHDLDGQGLTQPLDLGRVTQIALVHDLAESAITDLPHGAANYLGKSVKAGAEAAAMRDLAGELSADDDCEQPGMFSLWRAYAELGGPEARVVRDADKLEMIHQALVYELAGQHGLDEFWQGHLWHYPLSEMLASALAARRPRL